jgi:hypothetical protein
VARTPVAAGQPCGSLARVLARIYKEPRPEVLDLGPLCGQTVTYLAGRGARVSVETFDPPLPLPPGEPDAVPAVPPPIHFDQPDKQFSLVLAWELLDFVPPERMQDFAAEVLRVLHDGGWLFLFSRMTPPSGLEQVPRYRLLADDVVVREPTQLPARRRWATSTRDIERALKGFSIRGVQLQRNQMREFSAVKI